MSARRVAVVGSGTRFLSGISVYTIRLANALAETERTSVVTMRQLLPTRLYPGRIRVGSQLTHLARHPRLRVFDGIDWYWLPSMLRAAAFLARERPRFMIMQWWTGTVLHSYLGLAILARMMGTRVIVEFHEVLDTGEARIPAARLYVGVLAPVMMRLASAFAVHSAFDRELLAGRYSLHGRPVRVLPHGPHDHYQPEEGASSERLREAPEDACNILFFGVIRPYKGLEDLVAAFDSIAPSEIARYWLTVVGETWEGWDLPAQRIAASRNRERITLVNRYVHDRELDGHLLGADVVALPYHRSSLSGPLHVAMGYGLPILMSDVGGNAEAAEGYEGIVLVPPRDPEALREGLQRAADLRGRRFSHPQSWANTAQAYQALFRELEVGRSAAPAPR